MFTLLLGVIGIYGTMAYVVAQRRREIGIRIALGAHPSRAVSLMTKQGLKATFLGLAAGLFLAFVVLLWLSRNIVEVHFFETTAIALMTLLVGVTAALASYIPARRASRVDPMIVLRDE